MAVSFPLPVAVGRLDIPLGAEVPDQFKDQVVDPAEFVKAIQQATPDPLKVDPHSVRHFLDALIAQIDKFLKDNSLPTHTGELTVFIQQHQALDPAYLGNLLEIISELWSARMIMDTMRGLSSLAEENHDLWEKPEADGTPWYYKHVVGPLIDGQCYGAPVCSEEAIVKYGQRPMPITPVVAQPFVAMRAYGVLRSSMSGWFTQMVEALADSIEENLKAVQHAAEQVGSALTAAGTASLETAKKVGKALFVTGLVAGGLLLTIKMIRWSQTDRSEER